MAFKISAWNILAFILATHTLQAQHNMSMIYCTKVNNIFIRRRGRSSYWYTFCDIPNRCGMPAHKMNTGCVIIFAVSHDKIGCPPAASRCRAD